MLDVEPAIYTTGALLKPMKVINSNGKEIWLWYVSEFVDDSFNDGEVFNPKEFSFSKSKLLTEL